MHNVKNVTRMVEITSIGPAILIASVLGSPRRYIASIGLGADKPSGPGEGGTDKAINKELSAVPKINVKLASTTAGVSKFVGTEVVDIVSVL